MGWGDPVQSTVPNEGGAAVSTMHEGVLLMLDLPGEGRQTVIFGPEEARRIADNLRRAADQWEED
jgi:hypothetical protein